MQDEGFCQYFLCFQHMLLIFYKREELELRDCFLPQSPYLIFQKLGPRYLWEKATECDMLNLKMIMKSMKSSGWSFKTLEYLKAN